MKRTETETCEADKSTVGNVPYASIHNKSSQNIVNELMNVFKRNGSTVKQAEDYCFLVRQELGKGKI